MPCVTQTITTFLRLNCPRVTETAVNKTLVSKMKMKKCVYIGMQFKKPPLCWHNIILRLLHSPFSAAMAEYLRVGNLWWTWKFWTHNSGSWNIQEHDINIWWGLMCYNPCQKVEGLGKVEPEIKPTFLTNWFSDNSLSLPYKSIQKIRTITTTQVTLSEHRPLHQGL